MHIFFLPISIFSNFEALVVIIEIGGKIAVGVALAVVAKEMVDAVFEWAATCIEHTHAPFAHRCCLVARAFEDASNGYRFFRNR